MKARILKPEYTEEDIDAAFDEGRKLGYEEGYEDGRRDGKQDTIADG